MAEARQENVFRVFGSVMWHKLRELALFIS
jgi:hypothetical protein